MRLARCKRRWRCGLAAAAVGVGLVVGCGQGGVTTTTVTESAEPMVVVPEVIGKEQSQAESLLQAENLRSTFRLVYQYESLIQIGQVAEQDPAPGTQVPEFSIVSLRVAGGE